MMPDLHAKRVLITGASGFIGRHLSRRLLQLGCEVHAVTRLKNGIARESLPDGVIAHDFDACYLSLIEALSVSQPDCVVHLATHYVAEHRIDDLNALVDANIRMGLLLLQAMDDSRVKAFVNTGTLWQHFQGAEYSPVNLYAACKQAFDALLTFYVEARGFRVVTLELPDTYGPGDTRRKITRLLQESIENGRSIDLSGGEQQIDLLHVDDVVSGYVCALDRLMAAQVKSRGEALADVGVHERFALTSGRSVNLRDLAAQLSRAMGKPLHAKWGVRPYRQREVMLPSNPWPVLPGWAARRPFGPV